MLGKLVAALALIAATGWLPAQDTAQPKLFLNVQRLRRLKRDRERNTARWANFETRINNVADSEERGFELALYYAVTKDEAKGREAIAWALQHQSIRQAALVADWCAPLVSDEQKARLLGRTAAGAQLTDLRDAALLRIAKDGGASELPDAKLLEERVSPLRDNGLAPAEQFYALCELLYAARAATRTDLRETDVPYFAHLPEEMLLSAKPADLNAPGWMKHAAALALVALDPNLPGSQFLQSWALEDAQTLKEGPGVAYELLWADPYLPGVGYQNMGTFLYDDEHARLFARTDWEPGACWIAITADGIREQNCPAQWKEKTAAFGYLTLIPFTERCVEIPHLANHNESILVWRLKPRQPLTFGKGKEQHTASADATGIWHPGANIEGRVCVTAR